MKTGVSTNFDNRGKYNYPYECNSCEKGFLKEETYKRHILTDHAGLKPFKCTICSTEFSAKKALKVHMASFHENKTEETKVLRHPKKIKGLLKELKGKVLSKKSKKAPSQLPSISQRESNQLPLKFFIDE